MRLAFGEFILDVRSRELCRSGEPVPLAPQAFDLLVFLVGHRDRVVSKDEILDAVWGGRIVSDAALTTRINAVRRAVGDSGETQRLIRTFPRKGVRFIGEVRDGERPRPDGAAVGSPAELKTAEGAAGQGETHGTGTEAAPPPPLPDLPSIAVLPFSNLTADPDQEYFSDGVVDDIITALSRYRDLFVIARTSSFVFKNRAVDIRRIGRELGVRYVMEGSVRRVEKRVRITAQLIDATIDAHIWADRFDGTLDDLFALQDLITESVVGAIEPRLLQAEIERVRPKPTTDLAAYDHLLRAHSHLHAWTREGNDQALQHLSHALALDPHSAIATGLAAWCHVTRASQGWSRSPTERAEGLRLARVVADGRRDDALALSYASYALVHLGRDHDTALTLIDRALRLNANSAVVWRFTGWIRLYTHDDRGAIEAFERAHRLSPLDPFAGGPMTGLSLAHWFLGEFEASRRWARLAVQALPKMTNSHLVLIGSLVSLGRMEEARSAARQLMQLDPGFTLSRMRAKSPYQRVELLEPRWVALRSAGVPD